MPRRRIAYPPGSWLLVGLLLILVGCQPTPTASPAAAPPASGPAAGAPSAPPTAAPQPTVATVPSGPPDVVKVADAKALTSAGLYVALDKGYYRDENIDLQLETVAGGADVVPFLATGDLDINLGAISVGLFNAFDRG